MVRGIIIIMCLLTLNVTAQQEDYIRPGLIRSSATISPSLMLNRSETNYYITGFLEGYLDKHISLRGETHYYVDGKQEIPYLKSNIRTHFGIQYHRNKKNLDGYIGFMPGLDVMQINGDFNSAGENPYHVVPSFTVNVGVTFYVWKFFNFFADVSYFNSTARKLVSINGRTDEIMISAGLGFNINTVRAK